MTVLCSFYLFRKNRSVLFLTSLSSMGITKGAELYEKMMKWEGEKKERAVVDYDTVMLVGVQMEQWDDILLSFSSHSCCDQQAKSEEETAMYRERWIK